MGEVVFSKVAPVVPVLDLDAALERYRRLGFTVRSYDGDDRYGFVDRGAVSLHLSESDQHDPERTATVVYLYVSDADAVHAEWTAAGVDGHFRAGFDTAYGLREFGFVDPAARCTGSGHPSPSNESPVRLTTSPALTAPVRPGQAGRRHPARGQTSPNPSPSTAAVEVPGGFRQCGRTVKVAPTVPVRLPVEASSKHSL